MTKVLNNREKPFTLAENRTMYNMQIECISGKLPAFQPSDIKQGSINTNTVKIGFGTKMLLS